MRNILVFILFCMAVSDSFVAGLKRIEDLSYEKDCNGHVTLTWSVQKRSGLSYKIFTYDAFIADLPAKEYLTITPTDTEMKNGTISRKFDPNLGENRIALLTAVYVVPFKNNKKRGSPSNFLTLLPRPDDPVACE